MITFVVDSIDSFEGDTRRERELNGAGELLERLSGEPLAISHESSGRPYVAGRNLCISISHSPTRVAVALSDSDRVGIDVEDSAGKVARIINRVMTLSEIAAPDGVDPLVRWMVKEAVVKASLQPGLLVSEIEVRSDSTAIARGQSYFWISPEPGVALAVPLTARIKLLQCQQMP